ncbi:MLO-like protein 4 [Linum perenne]
MVVGTKLQQVVSMLALEINGEQSEVGNQVKPRDDLFWFGKPVILLRLIQFIIFQNAFEMATFLWSLWGLKQRSCFMKNHYMITFRLVSGVVVQFWCSHSTVPLNVLVTQMGSRCRKALVSESVRDSLRSWCKRVKERSKRDAAMSVATRSVCSLDTATIDEGDEDCITIASMSRSSSMNSLNEITVVETADDEHGVDDHHDLSRRIEEYFSSNVAVSHGEELFDHDAQQRGGEEGRVETLFDLFRRT